MLCTCRTINESYITAAKDIAITFGHVVRRTYDATTNAYISTAKDITLRTEIHRCLDLLFYIPRTITAPVVETTTSTKDITHHQTAIHRDFCPTTLVDFGHVIGEDTSRRILQHRTTSDRTNLTTSVETTAHRTAIHRDVGEIGITVGHITTTKDIASFIEQIITCFGIVKHRYIVIVFVFVTDMTIIERDKRCTVDGTTFATTIDITIDGWIARKVIIITYHTYDNMSLALNISILGGRYGTRMESYRAFPSTTIDVTNRTTLDIGIGGRSKAICTKEIRHASCGTCCIDVFYDRSA